VDGELDKASLLQVSVGCIKQALESKASIIPKHSLIKIKKQKLHQRNWDGMFV
jgi:hypothetical protein